MHDRERYRCRGIGVHFKFILSSATGRCCVVVAKQCMGCAHLAVGQEILFCASFESGCVLAFLQFVYSSPALVRYVSQCWLHPKQFYTPPSHTDQTDPPSPPHFPCSTSIRGARHNTVAGRASITHVWSRCSYTWCFTRMLLEQQLELRRIIAYTSWVLPRERAVCKFSRTSQWGTGASGSLMPRRRFYPCLLPLR